jgi:hypothetical protein
LKLCVFWSPRPYNYRARLPLLVSRCRDSCGGEGQGDGAERRLVLPPLPSPLPRELAD